MDLLNPVRDFIFSKEFWIYHGFVLSGLWVLLSAIAIFVKRFSIQLHLLLFVIINFTTIFFAGAALYRVLPGFANFAQWSTLKKGHIIGGILFSILVIIQHIGGVTSFLGKKANPQHRSFGKILVNIGRVVAAFGWILAGNTTNAIIVGVVSVVLLGLTFIIGPAKSSIKSTGEDDQKRSRSPRAKRQ